MLEAEPETGHVGLMPEARCQRMPRTYLYIYKCLALMNWLRVLICYFFLLFINAPFKLNYHFIYTFLL
jgi:hypothetical protein